MSSEANGMFKEKAPVLKTRTSGETMHHWCYLDAVG